MLNIIDDKPEDILPSYFDRGEILIEVISIDDRIKINECVVTGSAFWIVEGMGIEFWINEDFSKNDISHVGWWVIEGITGHVL